MDPQNPVSQVPSVPPTVPPAVPPVPPVPPLEPPNQPVQTPPPPANKTSLLFKSALFALLFSVVTAGIYLVWTKVIPGVSKKACTMEAKVCPDGSSVGRTGPNCEFAPCPSPTSTPDETANWKTYFNNKYKYAFKFPATWEYNRGPGNVSDTELGNQRDIDLYIPNLPSGNPGTGITVKVNELDAQGNSRNCTTLEDCIEKSFSWLPKTQEIEKGETTFLGQNAKTIKYTRITPLYSQTWKYVFVILDSNFYSISLSSETDEFDKNLTIFNQILSTFKFLESQASPSATPLD